MTVDGRAYWRGKYQEPGWGGSRQIHFARVDDVALGSILTADQIAAGIEADNQHLMRRLFEATGRHEEQLRVLEFGCGEGDLLMAMGRQRGNIHAIGIDISSTAIQHFRDKCFGQTGFYHPIQGSVERMEEMVGDEKFDAIVCRDTLYNLTDDEKRRFFAATEKLLAKGGVLYLADISALEGTPAYDDLQKHLAERQGGGRVLAFRDFDGDDPVSRFTPHSSGKANGHDTHAHLHRESLEHDHHAIQVTYSGMADSVKDDPVTHQAYQVLSAIDPQHTSRFSAIYRLR